MKLSKRIGGEAIVVLTAGFLIFQNCTQPVQQPDEGNNPSNNIAFAFDTEMDTLAYLSCSGVPQAENLWTFKLGAYGQNSGVKLSQSFFYDTPYYSDTERVGLLANSSENSGALIQVALRWLDSKQNLVYPSGNTPTEGVEYDNILAPLTNPSVSQPLIYSQGAPVNYFPQLGIENSRMEASIQLAKIDVTQPLAGTGRLMVTYKSNYTEKPYLARGPGNSVGESAYGRSYRLSFIFGTDTPGPRILAQATESDLLSGSLVSPGWVCPPNLRMRVAKTVADCEAMTDGDSRNAADPDPLRLSRLRRVLDYNTWSINLPNSCIYQNTGLQCYGSPAQLGNHYFSMCYRNL